jgi:hypothetical protein
MNKTDKRQDQKNKQAWHCYRCQKLVVDAEIFLVGNGQTGEAVVLHRACVTSLLSPLKRSLALHSQNPRSRPQRSPLHSQRRPRA